MQYLLSYHPLTNGLDQLVAFESTADYSKIPFGEQLSQIDIDFL